MKGSKDAIRTARQLLKATMAGGRLDGEVARKIVRRVAEKKPRGYLGILSAYQRLVRLELDKQRAVVESADVLGEGLRDQVVSDLRNKYSGDLATEFSVNEGLIGGMRVRVGSDVWDGSVRGRLTRLAENLS